jgi:hypothetical protein
MVILDKNVYIFLDESGKPEIYSKKGVNLVNSGTASKYLVIAAVKVTNHLILQQAVTQKRLEILKNVDLSSKFSPSYSLDSFHAQTDYQEVREEFFQWIGGTDLDLKISVIAAEKLKAYAVLQHDPGRFYAVVAGQLLKRILHNAENIEVIFSRRDASLKTKERLQEIVERQRLIFITERKIEKKTQLIYHHNPHYTHGGLQVADYIAYAIFQLFENNNRQWYEIIKKRIGYIQDLFNKKSYSKTNPL